MLSNLAKATYDFHLLQRDSDCDSLQEIYKEHKNTRNLMCKESYLLCSKLVNVIRKAKKLKYELQTNHNVIVDEEKGSQK